MSRRSSEGRFSGITYLNRALSIRSHKNGSSGVTGGGSSTGTGSSHRAGSGGGVFSFSSLRGTMTQPELSRRLWRLIKTGNGLISAHEAAGRERVSMATQLSEWGERTGDPAVSDLSDKVGVVLSEMGELEDAYAARLDECRATLKVIRNTEKSVQPSRDGRAKIADEIAKLKVKEPQSTRLVTLEQELVRAEAENLVAEAQLTNVTRQKLKEAYLAEFAATIERAEKQIILARHGRRLLHLLDDSPIVPGENMSRSATGDLSASSAAPYPAQAAAQARQVLNDAEDDLRDWRPDYDDEAGIGVGAGAAQRRREMDAAAAQAEDGQGREEQQQQQQDEDGDEQTMMQQEEQQPLTPTSAAGKTRDKGKARVGADDDGAAHPAQPSSA